MGEIERVEMGIHMPILMMYILEQRTEKTMLQSSVFSPLLSSILGRLYLVGLVIKPCVSETSELKWYEPKSEAVLKIKGLLSFRYL